MTFHHIGIFVKDIDYGQKTLQELIGIKKWSDTIHDPIQGVFVKFGYDSSQICYEIVAPADKHNPVEKVLRDGKNILNHIAFEVSDIDLEIKNLKSKGSLLISGPVKAKAFNNNSIAFLYTPLRFIIELIEK